MNTFTMQSSTSKVHSVVAECNDHTFKSCTVSGDLRTYRNSKGLSGKRISYLGKYASTQPQSERLVVLHNRTDLSFVIWDCFVRICL